METPWRRHPFDVLVALGVHTDRAPEPASSTVQATRDGACSDTQDQSHISAGPALEIHQVQHLPKRRRKPPDSPFESRVQDLAHHDRLGTVVRLQPLDDQGGRVRHHGWSRPASRPVDVSVAHDRQQPRPRVAAIEAVDAPIGTQQRVLHQVVTIGMMAGDRPRHPREHRQLRDDEPLEDLRCTLARRRIHTPSSGPAAATDQAAESLTVGPPPDGAATCWVPAHDRSSSDWTVAPSAASRRSRVRRIMWQDVRHVTGVDRAGGRRVARIPRAVTAREGSSKSTPPSPTGSSTISACQRATSTQLFRPPHRDDSPASGITERSVSGAYPELAGGPPRRGRMGTPFERRALRTLSALALKRSAQRPEDQPSEYRPAASDACS